MTFGDEDIDYLLNSKYGRSSTFATLSLLYPNLNYSNEFHEDHIHPRSWFKPHKLKQKGVPDDKRKFYSDNCDYLSNLQLLEGIKNMEKSSEDFAEWLNKKFKDDKKGRKEYMRTNYIPENIDLSFANFEDFLSKRKELIRKKLISMLI